jgi:hypothetical protein
MSVDEKRVIINCLGSEITAVERDIARTGPKRDHFGDRQFDVRQQHLAPLVSARKEVLSLPTPSPKER